MGVIWTPLTLVQPDGVDGTKGVFPQLPPGIPLSIEKGSRSLGVGLLVGEKLGLDLTGLTECLNTVWFGPPEEAKGMIIDDDLPVLVDGFTRIRDALRAAIDDQGRPRGAGGALLKASSSIEHYPDGGMVTRSRRVPLIDLLSDLDALIPFLRFAQEHGLFVIDGDWPRSDSDEG